MKTLNYYQIADAAMLRQATAALFLVFAAGLLTPSAQAADTEPADIPEHILAKMARYKTKRFGDESDDKSRRDRGDVVGECGGVNVGNVTRGRGVGRLPREVTVVITGDVINANNRCD